MDKMAGEMILLLISLNQEQKTSLILRTLCSAKSVILKTGSALSTNRLALSKLQLPSDKVRRF